MSYARQAPNWNWHRSFEHLGIFAVDPAVLFVATGSDLDDLGEILAAAEDRPLPVAVGRWESLETLVLLDAARGSKLRLSAVPVGEGAGLTEALARGALRLGFGRMAEASGAGRAIRVMAVAGTLGHDILEGIAPLDTALGMPLPPVGYFDVLTLHADFRTHFPARHARLARSFQAALADENYREAVARLGLGAAVPAGVDHAKLIAAAREWWDAAAGSGHAFAAAPAELTTRGKLTRVEDGGRRLAYLGLDGDIHELSADPDQTALSIADAAAVGADPLAGLKLGMLCHIAKPSVHAVRASGLACK